MAKYHISADGTPGICRATKGNCPLGGSENHYDTKEEAQAVAQERLEQESGLGFSSSTNPTLKNESSFKDEVTDVLVTNEDENTGTVYQFEGTTSYGEEATIETQVYCDEVDENDKAEGLEVEVSRRTDNDSESDTHHVSVSDAYRIAKGDKPEGDVHPEAVKAVQAFAENNGFYEGEAVDWEFGG